MTDNLLINPMVNAIYEWREKTAEQGNRKHLGFSQVGDSCNRKLWYIFRHVQEPSFEGRILRLFQRGHNEEYTFVEELRGIGFHVWDADPDTGKQISVGVMGGHVSGSVDAVIKAKKGTRAFEIAGKEAAVAEFKTHSNKSFKDLVKKGVKESKPIHYAQTNIYAHKLKLKKCVYIAVNKDNDQLHIERWHTDNELAEDMIKKGQWVASLQEPPEGISDNASWFECKFCGFSNICHEKKMPSVNCRTCLHSTPEQDGTWSCVKDMTFDECGGASHLYIPALVPLEQTNAGEDYVEYGSIRNGRHGDKSYESKEFKVVVGDVSVTEDDNIEKLRVELGMTFTGLKAPWENKDD